jgi:CDP-diglyceride synthetase
MASRSTPGAEGFQRSPLDIAAALLSLGSIVAIWLPFAWSTSPAKAVTDSDLWYLAAPFLLAIPIAAVHAWALARGTLPAGASWGARALAGCAMGVTALFYARVLREGDWPTSGADEWLAFLVPLGLAAGWVALVVRWRARRRAMEAAQAIALMESAYLVNAVLCLFAFASGRETGWYVTLAVAAAFAADVVATARGRR